MPRNYESYKQSGGGGYTGVWTPPNGKTTFNPTPGWRYKQNTRSGFKHQATEDWINQANRSFKNNQQQQNRQKQQEYYRSFNPPKPPGATWSTGSPRSAPPPNGNANQSAGASTPNGFHQPKPANGTDNWFRDRFDNFD